MSQLHPISVSELQQNVFTAIGKEWMLITAETEKDGKPTANTMTASWGGLGHLWNKDVAFAFIRPQRYTKEFVDNADSFSLCFFGGEKMQELKYLGTASGRDEDKIAKSGLTLTHIDGVPCFEEATTVLICRKMASQNLDPHCFNDKSVDDTCYPRRDYHTMYIGEVVEALRK